MYNIILTVLISGFAINDSNTVTLQKEASFIKNWLRNHLFVLHSQRFFAQDKFILKYFLLNILFIIYYL